MVRTRIAPSPTGEFHIGHLSTALRNLAFARNQGGKFIIRIEDTDQARYVKGSVGKMLDLVRTFDLTWDEGPDIGGEFTPYVQSKRIDIYLKHIQSLVDRKLAYPCFCTKTRLEKMRKDQQAKGQIPKYDRLCLKLKPEEIQKNLDHNEPHVIRMRVPDSQKINFQDLIRGLITVDAKDLDDQVILKSDGFPTYHLAVVVDDHLMKISHVIRGEEWISSTPKHILLYQFFSWQPPAYAHTPVFLNPDGKGKMSKRHGSTSVQSFLDQGYLRDAILNFLMIMGWSPKDGRELLTLEDFFKAFDLDSISAKSVVFDLPKLNWINGQYIRKLSNEDLATKLEPFWTKRLEQEKKLRIIPLVKDRLVKLEDIKPLTEFFYQDFKPSKSALLKKSDKSLVKNQLSTIIHGINNLANWTHSEIEQTIRQIQESQNWPKSQFFMLIRVATTGKTATPPLFETLELIGREKVISRLESAAEAI